MVLAAAALWIAVAIRARTVGNGRALPGDDRTQSAADAAAPTGAPAPTPEEERQRLLSAGWEEASETVIADLQAILDGRARSGAFAEAQAEAARQDLARYPPDRTRLRRMLMGSGRERNQALAALSARPDLDDDLVRLVLRSQRPEDDAVTRLLGAVIVAELPPDLLSRHEDDLLATFAGETNPLVLALALPALEQLDDERLRALVRAQLETASPPVLSVLVGLARDRLGRDALADVGILVDERPVGGP